MKQGDKFEHDGEVYVVDLVGPQTTLVKKEAGNFLWSVPTPVIEHLIEKRGAA